MLSNNRKIGRLALREEGENWSAYYAMPDTMEGAIFLSSIRMAIVTESETRKQQFMSLMRDVVADMIEEATGVRPIWREPQAAPEHERSGNA